ncbi:hypothetical protein [uncultured Rikenella sp.]|uniref:hypothetical protein n=2 Tax=uncultured Rikenella sp. TaxID=368003 RepID=UPI002614C566|nr:hypothetical protein [uncultured Rikenella sp.]
MLKPLFLFRLFTSLFMAALLNACSPATQATDTQDTIPAADTVYKIDTVTICKTTTDSTVLPKELNVKDLVFKNTTVKYEEEASNGTLQIDCSYVTPVNNTALRNSILKEYKYLLKEHIFWLSPSSNSYTTVEKTIDNAIKKHRQYIQDSEHSLSSIAQGTVPYLFYNKEITSISYDCYNSLGGSMNCIFDMNHVFRNRDGRRLYLNDIIKERDREEFFRIAYEEWDSEKMRWYNPFGNVAFAASFRYDATHGQWLTNYLLKKSFYFTPKGMVLSDNLYNDMKDERGEYDPYFEYGKTELLLPYEQIKHLLQSDLRNGKELLIE